MSETVRRVIKWTGYPLFALGVFLVFLYLSLPYEKIKARIEEYAGASGEMELTIGELGPRPLIGVSAERVVLVLKGSSTFGEKERPKPLRVSFESAVIKSGLLALIRGGVDVYVAASGLGGEIEASYESDKLKGWSVKGELSKITSTGCPISAPCSARRSAASSPRPGGRCRSRSTSACRSTAGLRPRARSIWSATAAASATARRR
jgi:type II secretion system protein N